MLSRLRRVASRFYGILLVSTCRFVEKPVERAWPGRGFCLCWFSNLSGSCQPGTHFCIVTGRLKSLPSPLLLTTQLPVCRLTCLLCPLPHRLHSWSPLRRGLPKLPDCAAPAARGGAGFALSVCAAQFSHHSRSVCLLVLGSSERLLSFSCLPSWAMFSVPGGSSCQPCGHG